jgi:predicted NUDIX family NTP pyrophosphohydrolase
MQSFPEIDRAEWFALETARQKIIPGQAAFLDRLASFIG